MRQKKSQTSAVRKGMSLTTEAIVMLVLAAVVLVSLLAFFGSTFTPAKDEAKKTFEQARWCGEYVRYDSDCSGGSDLSNRVDGNKYNDIRIGLEAACKSLGITGIFNPPDVIGVQLYKCCESFCGGKPVATPVATPTPTPAA